MIAEPIIEAPSVNATQYDQDLRRAKQNARGLIVAKIGANLCGLLFIAVLAREISPEQRGIAAVALVIASVAYEAFKSGVDQALLHYGPVDRLISAHLAIRLSGALLLLLASLLIYFVPRVNHEVQTASIAFAVGLAFQVVYLTPKLLMELNLRLAPLAFAELGAAAIGAVLGIAAAIAGLGWQAVAVQFGSMSILQAAFGFMLARNLLVFRPAWIDVKTMITQFGAPLWLSDLLGNLFKLDVAIVTYYSGVNGAGYYSMAMSIVMLFGPNIAGLIYRVVAPLYSRQRTNRASVARIYTEIMRIKVGIALPVYAVVAGTAGHWFLPLFGQTWAPALLAFQLMTLYMWIRLVYDDQSAIINIIDGRPRLYALIHSSVCIAFLLVAVVFGWAWPVAGVAMALLVVVSAAALGSSARNARSLHLSFGSELVTTLALISIFTAVLVAQHSPLFSPLARTALELLLLAATCVTAIRYVLTTPWALARFQRVLRFSVAV